MLFALSCFIIFLAAIVRGFSRFGFHCSRSRPCPIIYPPAEIVPPIFMLEVAASINLLPSIWKDIHWKSLGKSLVPLTIGCLFATPLGVWLLANLAPALMQLAISLFVLSATYLMWKGYALKTMLGRVASTAVGAASGLVNGAFGM